MGSKIETVNDFMFGSNGKTCQPMLPVVLTTRQQAYRTAAWIKIMGMVLPDDGTNLEFDEIEKAVHNI